MSTSSYQITEHFPDREEAGTPNIPGAVQLGAVLYVLQRIGMSTIHAAEQRLLRQLLAELVTLPQVRIYGDPDLDRTPRLGVVSFNLAGIEHGLVAAVLNDYGNVAVRNGCFCAHPYVRELLKPELWDLEIDPDDAQADLQVQPWRGMVRASLGLYSTIADIEALLAGIRNLLAKPDQYRACYVADRAGNFRHRNFSAAVNLFDPEAVLHQTLTQLASGPSVLY